MTPKKIPWWMPQIAGGEYALIKQVLDNNYTNQGGLTTELEKKVCEFLSVKHAIAVPSGTVALFLALFAAGVGKDDEVIVPDITYIATANAATLCGAKVVFVDVNDKLLLEASAVEKAITPKTKAIMPVHISGRAPDMKALLAIAKKHNLAVIEDAAEAFGSQSQGKYLGTYGTAGCFSLSPNKTITSGQGGIVVTNDDVSANRIRELKNQGVATRLTGGDDIHPTLGFNFKFTDLQAAVALGQFEELTNRLNRMKRNHELYKKHLKGVKEVKLFECDTEAGEVPQWTDGIIERRNELDAYLKTENIDCRKFWFPLHTQAPYKQDATPFPIASELGPKALWMPSAFTLTDEDVFTVCTTIKKFYQKEDKE